MVLSLPSTTTTFTAAAAPTFRRIATVFRRVGAFLHFVLQQPVAVVARLFGVDRSALRRHIEQLNGRDLFTLRREPDFRLVDLFFFPDTNVAELLSYLHSAATSIDACIATLQNLEDKPTV